MINWIITIDNVATNIVEIPIAIISITRAINCAATISSRVHYVPTHPIAGVAVDYIFVT